MVVFTSSPSSSHSSDIFSSSSLTDTHTVSKCLTITALENTFISAPLGFHWLYTREECEYKLPEVKYNNHLHQDGGLWFGNQQL